MVGLHFNTFEAHHAEMSLAFARAPGVEVHEDPDLTWTIARPAWPRCDAFLPQLPDCGAGARIRELTDLHDELGRMSRWWVGPSARPADLERVLVKRGFSRHQTHAVVIADVRDCSADPPGGLAVASQWNYPELDLIRPTTATRRDFRAGMEAIQSKEREGFWFVVARDGGRIVGESIIFVSGGILGIHTLRVPERMQRGSVRPDLVAGAVALANELGALTLIAYASVSAIPALIGAGFRSAGEMTEYRRPARGRKLRQK